jgi:hypothetical protein
LKTTNYSKTIFTAGALLAVIFTFALQAACFGTDFYQAKPEDVPDWAKQGMFQFIRIDGGRIESLKAERTFWGKDFSDTEKEVLSNIYTKYQDKLFEKLKEAQFNWIWVTWSCGWSTDMEKENREQLKKVIKRAHDEGMHVTAYLSATNMFWESMFKDEPESYSWVQLANGKPVTYGGPLNPMRFLADPRNPEWRKYIIRKAELAIAAGADAIFFDNIIGDKDGLKTLFSEFQIMATKKAAKMGKPKAILYVNTHLLPEILDINDTNEFVWNEFGKNTPGVWPASGWDVGNVRKVKDIMGAKNAWQPHKFEDDKYNCGPREKCIPTPVEQKLSIAEAWAFGSSFSRNIEGAFLKSLILGENEGTEAWAAIAKYNKWVNEHRNIYTETEPVARIALLTIHDFMGSPSLPDHAMAEMLIKQNEMFGVKVIKRLTRGVPMDKFKVLLIPDVIVSISDDEKWVLFKFVADGGKIFAKSPGAMELKIAAVADFYNRLKYTPIQESVTASVEKGEVPSDFIAEIESDSGDPVLKVGNTKYVAANVMAKKDKSEIFVHFVNYDHNKKAENVKVKVKIGSGYPSGSYKVSLISPDTGDGKPEKQACKSDTCEFTIDKIEHYTVAAIRK